MARAIEVTDSLSNVPEQIEHAAKVVGRGKARPKVFAAIYYHKKKVKTASEVAKRTGLPRIRVLQEGRHLVRNGIVKSAKKNGEPAYEMIEFFHTHKEKILKYAANPKKLEKLPTKRKTSVSVAVQTDRGATPRAVPLTIDDLDSFSAVKAVQPGGYIPPTVSEEQFKRGIQAILGESSVWKDWGGELADLVSTRVVYDGARIGAVFAFKGPGQTGPLVPKKMGKNGDQIQRMYIPDGRLFVVQYVGEVRPSINDLMRSLAVDKSVAMGHTIYYMVIDGVDSYRLLRAYPGEFGS